MPRLVLYTNPMSRGRIARWMLEEVGEPYEVRLLDYDGAMKAPDFLAINPMGKVPALTCGDTVVTECAAICTWLADAYPAAGLMPADRGAFYRWMFFGAGPVEQAVIDRALGVTVAADKRRMVGYGDFDQMVQVLADQVSRGPYLCGETFSAADVYLGSQIGWGLQFGTLPDRPEFRAYWARIADRPARLRADAADNAAAAG